MIAGLALALAHLAPPAASGRGGPPIDLSPHLPQATAALWAILGLCVLFFVLRPELWRRLFLTRVDPRPVALMRIVFGLVVLWSLVDLLPSARLLFTDEGLWSTTSARANYGGYLRRAWDPEHGFEHWYDPLRGIVHRFSPLHLRSDPPFVYTLYAAAIASLMAMILGFYTRASTLLAWFLVNALYIYSPIFYSGGDTVVRNFLYLGIFAAWGQAYSLDAWRRRRRAILGGAREFAPLPAIAAWPIRLMMLQLAIIYCATGALKAGLTWLDGSALYYALSLDHFYRHPAVISIATGLHRIGAIQVMTWATKLWETLFPLALVGLALQAFEREKAAGAWPEVARLRRFFSYAAIAGAIVLASYVGGLGALYYYDVKHSPWPSIDRSEIAVITQTAAILGPALVVAAILGARRFAPRAYRFALTWLLGRRFWLGVGLLMHVGIDLLMNVGTFVQVMMAVYLVWLRGDEVDRLWRFIGSRPLRPGEPGGPADTAATGPRALLRAPLRRLRWRTPRPTYTVLHHPSEASIRRAALLRCWDLCGRLDFEADASVPAEHLALRTPAGARQDGVAAAANLVRLLPGLWALAPFTWIPGVRLGVGALARRVLAQR